MDVQDFTYRPLEPRNIRVLQVELGRSPFEPVSCKCIHLWLDDPLRPPYVAVSYVWGYKTLRPYKIFVDGRPLSITQNVYDILRSERMTGANVALWIDAICINQDHKEEKSLQVGLMGEIYSRADSVKVWLGPSGENSSLAMSFATTLYSILPELETMDMEIITNYEHKYPEGAPEWVALANLLNRQWFTRTWVIQEVVLSTYTEIICGNDTVSWDTIVRVVAGLNNLGFGGMIDFTASDIGDGLIVILIAPGARRIILLNGLRQCRHRGEPLPLLSLMVAFSDAGTTDKLDKVYSFLGIATDVNNPIFTPDYTEGNSPRKLFISMSRLLLSQDTRFNLLRYGGLSEETTIPSWTFSLEKGIPRQRLGNYQVANTEGQNVLFSNDGNEISLRGIVIDSIDELGNAADYKKPGHTAGDGQEGKYWVWYLEAKTLFQSTPSAKDEEVFWRTLLANRISNMANFGEEIEYVPGQEYGQLHKDFENNSAQMSVAKDRKEEVRLKICPEGSRATKFMESMLWRIMSRRFCVLRGHSVGLMPTKSRPGDLVVAFLGATVLFVIRPVTGILAGPNKYHLIGECYVHNRMDGEALDLALEVQEITLV